MHAKISVFVICVEVIIYLVLYNLHDSTFNITVRVNFAAVAVAATAAAAAAADDDNDDDDDDDDDVNDDDDSFLQNV